MLHRCGTKPNESAHSQVNEQLAALNTDGVNLTMPELLAYREQSRHLSFSLKPRGYLAGKFLSRSKGRGMEFDEVRQYQHGDDVRTIDWHAYSPHWGVNS